ncbi:hypothetical protein FSP39_005964 [Pinctada imbricata]|uniref:glycerophosphocholine cholinephosphodiesterase n=1 Tax=Pinctada imbricata TaxID=66713 RepID=A0AA88XMN1_PINIB|nr:hypothetical protein FSP39_005964 [Pinctada imbricata]
MDGFRWDYIDLPDVSLPGFQQMFREGVRAKYMVSDFPTTSYPNYYSIMTGLHCESHGFVGNYMYDVGTGKEFLIGTNPDQYLPIWWDDGEPLWVTAEKQNKSTYFYYWPGCEVTIRGVDPTYCNVYTRPTYSADLATALSEGLQLFKNDSADIVVYLEALDKNGHMYGAASEKVKDSLRDIDLVIQTMLLNLSSMGLRDEVNVMIFSDHGMINRTGIANLTSFIDLDDLDEMLPEMNIISIWPKQGKTEKVISDITAANVPGVTVYRKGNIPDRWLLKGHKRTPPVMVVTDPANYVLTPKSPNVYEYPTGPMVGLHGFDNVHRDMRAMFAATGPAFNENKVIEPIKNIELYQVMCLILGINPAPHNGTWSNVKDMLKLDTSMATKRNTDVYVISLAFGFIFGIYRCIL